MQISEEYQLPIPKKAFEYLVEAKAVEPMPEGCTLVQEGMRLYIEMEIDNGDTQLFRDRVKKWLDGLIYIYGQKADFIALNEQLEAIHNRLKFIEGFGVSKKWWKPEEFAIQQSNL